MQTAWSHTHTHSPGLVVQAALHEVQGALRQTGVTTSKLDLSFLDVFVLVQTVLRVERTVSAQPNESELYI